MTATLARRLALAALGLGILGNWVFRADTLRLGFVLWVVGLAAVAWVATPPGSEIDPRRPREHRLLLAAAMLIASLFVLRDAPILFAVDFFALIVLAAVIGWRAAGRPLAALVPRDAVAGGLAAVTTAVAGAPVLALRDAAPHRILPDDRRTLGGFAIGTIAALPVLFVVTALLASADPVFEGFLEQASRIFELGLVGHAVGIAFATWVSAGALRGALVSLTAAVPTPSVLAMRVRFPVVAPVLVGLAVLLSAWIGLQVRVLFGGSAYVVETAGVTVAEYARSGFFELVVVAGIVLAVLLVADDLLERDEEGGRRSFRAIGLLLLGLVGVLLASALQRLALYLGHFGLTADRVLALAVLVWVALVLGWFGWTVLRDARHRFAPGVLALSAAWLLAFNAANPERWIVRTNLARAESGKEFDVAYHVKLSGDAVPALLAGASRLGPAIEAALLEGLRAEWVARAAEREDWRWWNLPGARALDQVRAVTATTVTSPGASGTRRATAAR